MCWKRRTSWIDIVVKMRDECFMLEMTSLCLGKDRGKPFFLFHFKSLLIVFRIPHIHSSVNGKFSGAHKNVSKESLKSFYQFIVLAIYPPVFVDKIFDSFSTCKRSSWRFLTFIKKHPSPMSSAVVFSSFTSRILWPNFNFPILVSLQKKCFSRRNFLNLLRSSPGGDEDSTAISFGRKMDSHSRLPLHFKSISFHCCEILWFKLDDKFHQNQFSIAKKCWLEGSTMRKSSNWTHAQFLFRSSKYSWNLPNDCVLRNIHLEG